MIVSTREAQWITASVDEHRATGQADSLICIDTTAVAQTIEGLNLTINRMPVAANDFSCDYYSYDEVAGDFELAHFSIANDEETLIPFIQAAQRVNPDMKIWASPWCPPQWMKDNGHYACRTSKAWVESSLSTQKRGAADANMPVPPADDSPLRFRMTPVDNGLDPAQQRLTERTDVFIQEERYLDADDADRAGVWQRPQQLGGRHALVGADEALFHARRLRL